MVEPVYTVEEVAESLKTSTQTVRRYLKAGVLGGFKMGNEWRIRESDLEAFIAGDEGSDSGARDSRGGGA